MEDFLHVNAGGRVRRPYSPPSREGTGGGRSAVVNRWSNPSVKDLAHRLKTGKGAAWEVCELGALAEDYARQVDGERKKEVRDRFGRPVLRWVKYRENHAWDCECMSVAAACMAGLFTSGAAPAGSPPAPAPAATAPRPRPAGFVHAWR